MKLYTTGERRIDPVGILLSGEAMTVWQHAVKRFTVKLIRKGVTIDRSAETEFWLGEDEETLFVRCQMGESVTAEMEVPVTDWKWNN